MIWIQFLIFILVLVVTAKPLGLYIKNVLCSEKTFLDFLFRPIELAIYKICCINPEIKQSWKQYSKSLLVFSLLSLIIVFILLKLQYYLPFNPQHFTTFSTPLAFNTAASFVGNTNWQSYAGETTASYFTQMAVLAVENFLSAAVGIAVCMTLIRAFASSGNTDEIGNFWFDLIRTTLWILLPISIILATIYIWQGVPQNLNHYTQVFNINGATQILPQGPIASQEAIKSLGTNGGGFFNANSAHPFENPTVITNFLQALSIFLIAAALTNTFGRMINDEKQGWTILIVMLILFVISFSVMYYFETHAKLNLDKSLAIKVATNSHNLEGKETRFGVFDSALYNTVSTSASDGGVNSMLDSYTPIGGAMALINMLLGELIIGGVGSGLYTMLLYVILAIFIAGLMVGRTPEFLGKKIESYEMKMTLIAVLVSPIFILLFTALAAMTKAGISSTTISGPHGFTQILYAFTSSLANNGSAFAGLNANTNFYNICTGLGILIGRYAMIVPILAISGSIMNKKKIAQTQGNFVTTGLIFGVLLILTILLIAGLTFFPALTLGPILEHLQW